VAGSQWRVIPCLSRRTGGTEIVWVAIETESRTWDRFSPFVASRDVSVKETWLFCRHADLPGQISIRCFLIHVILLICCCKLHRMVGLFGRLAKGGRGSKGRRSLASPTKQPSDNIFIVAMTDCSQQILPRKAALIGPGGPFSPVSLWRDALTTMQV
jgi:hypothetical protein